MGLAVGGIIGALIHFYSHYSEGRLDPAENLSVHIFSDLIFGIFIALIIAMIVLFSYHFKKELMSP